jgi:hypothetical protein
MSVTTTLPFAPYHTSLPLHSPTTPLTRDTVSRFFAGLIVINLAHALVRIEHYSTIRSISCSNRLAATLALKTRSVLYSNDAVDGDSSLLVGVVTATEL